MPDFNLLWCAPFHFTPFHFNVSANPRVQWTAQQVTEAFPWDGIRSNDSGTIILPRKIYSFFFYLLMPAVLLRLFWRSIREPLYRQTLLQRFGFVEFDLQDNRPLIWVHAVSAGETIAAVPLIRKLLAHDFKILVTTMTPTGREPVLTLLGESVLHCYAP